MTRPAAAALVLATALLCAGAAPDEPDAYRMDHYGAPTPATLRGATVLSTAQAHTIWAAGGAIFIDVLPHVPRPPDLPAGTLWIERPHLDIPGSIWLPDTGYGALAPVTQRYFAQSLRTVTAGDVRRAMVFYCKPDCWMSWNAARRALSLGYTRVDWYPDGAAGWKQAGYPLERREPMPPASQ